jgi:hypothetical protein
MMAKSRAKWILSFLVGAILLVLGFIGGSWGRSYAAVEINNPDPQITRIDPSGVPVGSNDIVMVISGSGFEIDKIPRVMLTAPGMTDVILDAPQTVLPNGISQFIGKEYFTQPILYTLYVVQSNHLPNPTIPTIPITPWDEQSNPLPFLVFEPYILPLVYK